MVIRLNKRKTVSVHDAKQQTLYTDDDGDICMIFNRTVGTVEKILVYITTGYILRIDPSFTMNLEELTEPILLRNDNIMSLEDEHE